MAKRDDTTRRGLWKWGLYAALLVLFIVMVIFVDPHENARERVAFTLGAFITLALYSFLFGENEIYRFIEHLMVGVIAAQSFMISIEQLLYTKWFLPMVEGFKQTSLFSSDPSFDLRVLWIIAPVFGSFWYMIYSKKYLWLSRLIALFMIGAGVGGVFRANFTNLVLQAKATFKPLSFSIGDTASETLRSLWGMFGNLVFVVSTLLVLFYFLFTFRFTEKAFARRTHMAGRLLMMVAFGVLFGTIVGTRMGLLIGRMYFLVVEWATPIVTYWLG